jgi:hypothetical protein
MSQRHHRSRSTSAERMENDLNRSINKSFRESPAEVTRSSRADSCGPSQGTSTQPKKAIAVQGPADERNAAKAGPIAPLQEGPAGGSCVDKRGGEDLCDLAHGADYGGYSPTKHNSSMVDDDEAAARLEYEYQRVQRQSSRTHSHRDSGGRPRSGVRGQQPSRSSLDCRPRERDSSHARFEDVLTRMERQLAASTSAMAKMTAAHASSSGPGEYISLLLELFKSRLYCSNFT